MQKDAVADKRRHPFFTIDNDVILEYGPKIGSNALALYVILACHARESSGTCYPSIKRLMLQMQRSREVVFQAIETLKEHKLILVTGRRDPDSDSIKSNLYTLLPIAHPSSLCELPSSDSALGSTVSEPPLVDIADYPSSHSGLPLVRYPNTNKTNSEQDEVNKTNLNKRVGEAQAPAFPKMKYPTEQEAIEFFLEHGGSEEYAVKFWTWYEPIGWTQGKARSPIKNWQVAARRWISDEIRDNRARGERNGNRGSPGELQADDGKLAIVRHAEANAASVGVMRAKMGMPPNP